MEKVEWVLTHVPATPRPSVLDVGTGNGHLFAMAEAGYDATRLTVIDYSQGLVDLSVTIAKHRDQTESEDRGKGATYANVTIRRRRTSSRELSPSRWDGSLKMARISATRKIIR